MLLLGASAVVGFGPLAPVPATAQEPTLFAPGVISTETTDDLHPTLSPDGCTLYFGRDDPTGVGLGDLFVSRWTGDGWSEPENLGTSINSSQFDFAPRISPDGRRLFFSSNRSLDGEGRGPQNIYFVELGRGSSMPTGR